jgi:hypothetical protein
VKWELDGKYALRCGDCVITKNATGEGWVYLAFRGKELIGRTKSADEAKALFARHDGRRK